jgi:hypothetical protein
MSIPPTIVVAKITALAIFFLFSIKFILVFCLIALHQSKLPSVQFHCTEGKLHKKIFEALSTGVKATLK